jgi:cellulose synthase/poly-beta-1,6-N-acetylglucosamine synthase-like glycosyltransferase
MTERPVVSVVIETVTTRHVSVASMVADMAPCLAALHAQTYPADRTELIVVTDPGVPAGVREAISELAPRARFTESPESNYPAAKNAGAQAARGSIVAYVDADCVTAPDWLEQMVGRFEPGVAAVTGRTRYIGGSRWTRMMSVPSFGYAVEDGGGEASSFNLNNSAFARAVILQHPLEERVRRDGACSLLRYQLRAAGKRVVYEPEARATHTHDEITGLNVVKKHYHRGFDGASLYFLDDRGVFQGTRLVRRFGAAALVGVTARRVLRDWGDIARHRRQIGVPARAIPAFAAVSVVTRTIELAGMMAYAGERSTRRAVAVN